MPYICASAAKQIYKLSEKDLEGLDCEYVRNLYYYSSAAPTRLYDEDQVRKRAEVKDRRSRARTAKENIQIARELLAECKRTIESWTPKTFTYKQGYHSHLPVDVWATVLVKLCDDIETGGVRGVSVVARDICNACLSCADIKAASQLAFDRLALYCPDLPGIGVPRVWDQFFSRPMSVKVEHLKAMARKLKLTLGGTKAVLICRIFQYFRMNRPSEVPAKVLNRMREEKAMHRCQGNLSGLCVAIGLISSRFESDFRIREICVRSGSPTLAALRARRAVVMEERRAREASQAAEREKQAKLHFKALCEKTLNRVGRVCVCGFTPATKCIFQRCVKCCPGPCSRHRK